MMNFAVNDGGSQQRDLAHPACLQTVDVLDRAVYGPDEFVAPWAKTCLVVRPLPMTETYLGLFETGWKPNPGRTDVYGLYVNDMLIYIGLENGVWMIEASFPGKRKAPVVLGLGCSLVVTESPQAAAQFAKLCIPGPVSPLQWLPYW